MKSEKCFIIAEIAQAHEGSLGMLHSYIDAVAKTGVDAIKFQTHIAEAESSEFEPFRVKLKYQQDATRFDYWKRMQFNQNEWQEIKDHCDEVGLEFMSSPFSIAAVEILEAVGMKKYKIASGEVTNYLMLDRIARIGKPILVSSGMSSFKDVEGAINFLKPFNSDISIFQCTTSYPVKAEELGLNVLSELYERFKVPVGLSDHSGTIYPSLAAVTMGASLLEVHTIFNKEMFGLDAKASVTIDELSKLVEGVRYIETAMANPVKKDDNEKYTELKRIFGKSLSVRRDMLQGETITIDDLETKKPEGYGISPKQFADIIGKRLRIDKIKNSFLKFEDLEI